MKISRAINITFAMVESYFGGLGVGCSGLDLVSWPARPVQQADPNHTESGSTPSVFAWINHDDKITFTLLLFPSSKLLLPKNFGTDSYEFINDSFA